MKRRLTTLLARTVGFCLLSFGFGLAQPILTSYRDATAALRSSVEAFPTDQVESLDTLRKAETAFEPLGAVLEPTLRRGLNETFSRAEEAIVNQSETDLQVQAAVLQGGFGRAVYQQALQNAANGELESAKNLLSVLSQDLGFENTQLEGSSQEALQGAFEARLAARSLAQLGTFGGDLGNRYRTLAQLYSYIFLVQDSPRLPPKTRDTVVGTIRALVAKRPTDEGISLLRSQLTGFARGAERVQRGAERAQAGGAGESAGEDTAEAAAQNPGATPVATANQATGTAPAADTGAVADTTANTTAEAATDAAAGTTPSAEADAEPFVPPVTTATPGDTIVDGNPQPTFPDPSDNPNSLSPDQTAVAAPDINSTLPFLTRDVRALLFAAAGLLALMGLVRLLFAPSLSPWRDAALALLLLPAVLEGLIALASLLAPLVNQPQLAQIGAYSFFTHPVMQLVWVLLSAAAVLCLALGWRTPKHRVEPSAEDELDGASWTERTQTAAPSPQTPRSGPLTTGNLNWDEDF